MERGADVEEKGLEEKRKPEKTWQQPQTHEKRSQGEGPVAAAVKGLQGCDV